MPETPEPEQTDDTQQTDQAPDLPWGSDDEFDAEKAKKLILALRADKEKLSSTPRLTAEQQQQLAEYNALVEASKSDQERLQEELNRWQNDAQTWRRTAVAARIEALAASDFADPTDAATTLDAASYLDAGGQIDEPAIKRDLAQLLERKPHWRRTPSGPQAPRVPAPRPEQGSGGGKPATGDPGADFAAILTGLNAG